MHLANASLAARQKGREKKSMNRMKWLSAVSCCWRPTFLKLFDANDDTSSLNGTRSPLLQEHFDGFSQEDDSSFTVKCSDLDFANEASNNDRHEGSALTKRDNVRLPPNHRTYIATLQSKRRSPHRTNTRAKGANDTWPSLGDGTPTTPSYMPTIKAKMVTTPKKIPPTFIRTRTVDSFGGSLESIDSLAESYWDPEDDSSLPQSSPSGEVARSREFFHEHVHFLKVQTQPRQVEVVWTTE
jgi:hypothetical protein